MNKRRIAFTLAEVLITLGIIGVVAAMTLPALIQKNNNRVVETRLAKFYTTFNQAIQLAEVEFGDKKDWYLDTGGVDLDDEGKPIEGTAKIDIWFQKYFSKFIVIKKQVNTSGTIRYYLSDGSAFQFGNDDMVNSSRGVVFFVGNPEKCPQTGYGQCKFYFLYMPVDTKDPVWKYHYNRGLEPFKYSWDGRTETAVRNCKNGTGDGKWCTLVIQLNGWKIPDDYPYKVSY